MTEDRRRQTFKIVLLLVIAALLLLGVEPGLQDSPYNEF